jgi:hypothetical protein
MELTIRSKSTEVFNTAPRSIKPGMTGCSTATALEKDLNEIYVTVIKNSVYPDYTDEEREEHCKIICYILGSVVVVFSHLSARPLSRLLHVTGESVN